MPHANELLQDFEVAQQTFYFRRAALTETDTRAIFHEEDLLLVALLSTLPSSPTKTQLRALRKRIEEAIAAHHSRILPILQALIEDVAEAAAHASREALLRLTVNLDISSPQPGVVKAKARGAFRGATLEAWAKDLHQGDAKRVWRTVLNGVLSNKTTPEIVAEVRGTQAVRFKDGIREVSRRGLKTLIRTAVAHAASQGRQTVLDDNEDIFRGVQWLSTLDTRTSPICRLMDNRVGPTDPTNTSWIPPKGAKLINPIGLRPPAHPNCRSAIIPLLKSFEELGITLDRPLGPDLSTRASMTGQVPSNLSYYGWLKRQPAAIQREVLGPTRYKLWKQQNISPESFHKDDGRLLTLDELQKRTDINLDRLN